MSTPAASAVNPNAPSGWGTLDKVLTYIPGVSTVYGVAILIFKGLNNKPLRGAGEGALSFATYLKGQAAWRYAAALIPVIGNIILATYDLLHRNNPKKPVVAPYGGGGGGGGAEEVDPTAGAVAAVRKNLAAQAKEAAEAAGAGAAAAALSSTDGTATPPKVADGAGAGIAGDTAVDAAPDTAPRRVRRNSCFAALPHDGVHRRSRHLRRNSASDADPTAAIAANFTARLPAYQAQVLPATSPKVADEAGTAGGTTLFVAGIVDAAIAAAESAVANKALAATATPPRPATPAPAEVAGEAAAALAAVAIATLTATVALAAAQAKAGAPAAAVVNDAVSAAAATPTATGDAAAATDGAGPAELPAQFTGKKGDHLYIPCSEKDLLNEFSQWLPKWGSGYNVEQKDFPNIPGYLLPLIEYINKHKVTESIVIDATFRAALNVDTTCLDLTSKITTCLNYLIDKGHIAGSITIKSTTTQAPLSSERDTADCIEFKPPLTPKDQPTTHIKETYAVSTKTSVVNPNAFQIELETLKIEDRPLAPYIKAILPNFLKWVATKNSNPFTESLLIYVKDLTERDLDILLPENSGKTVDDKYMRVLFAKGNPEFTNLPLFKSKGREFMRSLALRAVVELLSAQKAFTKPISVEWPVS